MVVMNHCLCGTHFVLITTPVVEKERKDLQIECTVIPGGCTLKAQPLDVSLNKPFKDIQRKCWENSLIIDM